MKTRTTTLNFGTIGRCACGAIGRRRAPFAGEPICRKCMPMRSGALMTIRDVRDQEVAVGTMTRAQRLARRRYLADTSPLGTRMKKLAADVFEGQLGYEEQLALDGRIV